MEKLSAQLLKDCKRYFTVTTKNSGNVVKIFESILKKILPAAEKTSDPSEILSFFREKTKSRKKVLSNIKL